jgi:hypothetical protein
MRIVTSLRGLAALGRMKKSFWSVRTPPSAELRARSRSRIGPPVSRLNGKSLNSPIRRLVERHDGGRGAVPHWAGSQPPARKRGIRSAREPEVNSWQRCLHTRRSRAEHPQMAHHQLCGSDVRVSFQQCEHLQMILDGSADSGAVLTARNCTTRHPCPTQRTSHVREVGPRNGLQTLGESRFAIRRRRRSHDARAHISRPST